jgi:hypothetical protein
MAQPLAGVLAKREHGAPARVFSQASRARAPCSLQDIHGVSDGSGNAIQDCGDFRGMSGGAVRDPGDHLQFFMVKYPPRKRRCPAC